MDTLEAIMTRRSVGTLSGPAPERATIETLLEAAVRAPNHFLTQPWRFVVLGPKALDDLGEAMANRIRAESPDDPALDQKMASERARPHRAPVIVALVYEASSNPRAVDLEDRYAVGAAIENFMLAAHSLGLGSYLRTGKATEDPGVRNVLGIQDPEELVGFLYLGHPPAELPPLKPREPAAARTVWLD